MAGLFLNNRGLFVPTADVGSDLWLALLLCLALAGLMDLLARRALLAFGRQGAGRGVRIVGWILLLGLALFFFSPPVAWDIPTAGFFGVRGGASLPPEFLALLIGLSLYTAAFIAEIVRAGLQGVDRGQYEAAQALGLRRSQALRLVLVPQALRIILPPLANQYQSVFRNSSPSLFRDRLAHLGVACRSTVRSTESLRRVRSRPSHLSGDNERTKRWRRKQSLPVPRRQRRKQLQRRAELKR